MRNSKMAQPSELKFGSSVENNTYFFKEWSVKSSVKSTLVAIQS